MMLRRRKNIKAKTAILTVLTLVLAIVVIQNTHVVEVRLLFWVITMPRIIFIPSVFILGFLAGLITTRLVRPKKIKSSKHSPPDDSISQLETKNAL